MARAKPDWNFRSISQTEWAGRAQVRRLAAMAGHWRGKWEDENRGAMKTAKNLMSV